MRSIRIDVVGVDAKGCELFRDDDLNSKHEAVDKARRMARNAEYIAAGLKVVNLMVDGVIERDFFAK